MRGFPWSEAMAFGFGVMRLSSREFWGLTPRELAAAFGGAGGHGRRGSPPTRDGLTEMMRRFPDEVEHG
ncbi:MAG: phage tail assembly chaperone [Caulobacteraceae bacterium]|nr:MAG: phage tail assembly chaperone [Caulobacteraceae bacterium]